MLATSLLLCAALIAPSDWLERKAEGWAWYEKEGSRIENKQPEKPISPKEEIAKVKEELEEKLSLALLYPTEENVHAYMNLQHKWLAQSASFAHTWAKVLLQDPHIDYSVMGRPTTHYGVQLHKELENENQRNLMQNIVKEYGFFFFYEGKSRISQALALVVEEFALKYGLEVIAISVDDTSLEIFPESKIDNGISEQFGIAIFPALYLVQPQTKIALPIAFGLVSVDQIEKNIALQFNEQ